jgi:hypothetical protein
MALDANGVLVYLRRCGVATHHVAPMPATEQHTVSLVVFLEGNLCQHELAEEVIRRIPGVETVSFSGSTRSILYVTGTGQD